MATMLYVREERSETWMGRFKNREAAEEFFFHWQRTHGKQKSLAIYVETGKRKGEGKR